MKKSIKKTVLLFLLLITVSLSAQQSPQIINVEARQTISLNGHWKTIVDPFENGYYDYRSMTM